MKIIINPTDKHIIPKQSINPKEDLIISQFKIDSLNFNHIFLPPTGSEVGNLNHSFWIINSSKYIKIKDISQIEILGINFIIHYLNEKRIIKKESSIELCKESKKQPARIIIRKKAVEKAIKYPFLFHYFDRNSNYFKNYYEFWFLCIENKIVINYDTSKLKIKENIKKRESLNNYKLFEKKYDKLLQNDGFLVNLGNEGELWRNDTNTQITKIVQKWDFGNLLEWIDEFVPSIIYDGPLKFYGKDLNITKKDVLNKMENKIDIHYTYENKLLPTTDFTLPKLARFIKDQIDNDVYIMDIKKENFAKLELKYGFFKLIYSDFGKGFIKINQNKDKFILGLCRDLFILFRDYKSWKYRETIRASREAITENDIAKILNQKIILLYKFVECKYDDDLWPCHNKEDHKKCEEKKWKNAFNICSDSSSMRFLRKKKENKLYVYDLKTHKTYKCKSKRWLLLKNIKIKKIIGLNDNLDEGIIRYEGKNNCTYNN